MIAMAACQDEIDDGITFTQCEGTCCEQGCCETQEEVEACALEQQQVFTSEVTPKPLSGGTLLVTKLGHAIVADPYRDRIVIVDLSQRVLLGVVGAPPGSEPGRLIEGGDGRVFVVLRAAGQIMAIDPGTMASTTTPVPCAAPRGIAVGPGTDGTERLFVACAGGELLTLSTGPTLEVLSKVMLGSDLRDVVSSAGKLYVSHFRSTAIDVLDPSGAQLQRLRPPDLTFQNTDPATGASPTFTPSVAWRMVARPGGGIYVIHQQAKSSVITAPDPNSPAVYYQAVDCGTAIMTAKVTGFDASGYFVTGPASGTMILGLPVDVAVSPDGSRVAAVGNSVGMVMEATPEAIAEFDACSEGGFAAPIDALFYSVYEPTSVAYDAAGDLVVLQREPPAIVLPDRETFAYATIELGGSSRLDTGYAMFHGDPDFLFANVACASCHPEGGDDGHVWTFSDAGPRRTQSLAGDIRGTAPFHWKGEIDDVGALMSDVFVKRMSGQPQSEARVAAISSYLGSLPAAPRTPVADPDAALRGAALFLSDEVGCSVCHAGSRLTSAGSYDVGTGGKFQVPSLNGLGTRAPYMHDGCAATLADRFDPACGGGDLHGKTSHLTPAEIGDLVAYLESL